MAPLLETHGRISPQVVIFPLLLLLAATSVYYWYARRDEGDGALQLSGIVEGDMLSVGSKVGGRLGSVLVEEGQELSAGELVAEFEIPELEAQRDQLLSLIDEAGAGLDRVKHGPRPQEIAGAKAGVDAARAALDELTSGSREEDIAQARAAMKAVEAQLQLAESDAVRARELYDADVLPRKDLDAAEAAVAHLAEQREAARQVYEKALAGPRQQMIDAAEARLDSAQASLSLLQAGSRSEDIEMASARLASVEAQLAGLETQIAEARVTAPAAGSVLTRNFLPGDLVAPGAPVITLLASGSYFVQTFVPEGYLSWAVPGTTVELSVDTLPGQTFRGTVEFLSVSGEFTPRNLQTKETRVEQVYRCKIGVDDAGGVLRPGMACEITFTEPAGQGS